MFNAAVIIVTLIVVASLLQRIRLANLLLKRAELAHVETLQYLADVSYELDMWLLQETQSTHLAVDESGQVNFFPLVPDDTAILMYNGYEIDYGSLLSYERGDSDSIVVYNL